MSEIASSDDRLKLILVSDGVGDVARVEAIVQDAVRGGLRCVQLREPTWSARDMLRVCERLKPLLDDVGGLLLVNDRLDVVSCGAAHGAQVGHRSLPLHLARAVIGPHMLLGYSAHGAKELAEAAEHGCNFALLAPVWATTCKPEAVCLGVRQAGDLTAQARLPVVWLGGVGPNTMAQMAELPVPKRPIGVAVRSAIMESDDPCSTVRTLLAHWPS